MPIPPNVNIRPKIPSVDPLTRTVNTSWLMGWLTGLVVAHTATVRLILAVTRSRLESEDTIAICREFDRDVIRADVIRDRHLTEYEKGMMFDAIAEILPYDYRTADHMEFIRRSIQETFERTVGQRMDSHARANIRQAVILALDEIRHVTGLGEPPPFNVESEGSTFFVKFITSDSAGWEVPFKALGIPIYDAEGERIG